MITINTILDMRPGTIPKVIHLSQYDSDFSLVFRLHASFGVLNIESGTTAEIRGTKKSGTGYSASATLNTSNNTVTVTGDAQMTAVAGQNIYEIVLIKNNKVLGSANFVLLVERAALDADTITDATVLKELNAIIDSVETATQAAEDAADAADRAEAAAEGAENKVSKPASNPDGTAGQILRTNGDGTTEWANGGTPTDEQTAEAVSDWLDDHPEATTTVQDGSIDFIKFSNALKTQIKKTYQNVSEMIADTSVVSGQIVQTSGYYSFNDGGEAVYHIESSVPNTYYETLSNGLYARLIVINNTVHCKQFGIKDGDDCAQLFTYLISNYDNVVFSGNYVCNSTIIVSGKGTSLTPVSSRKLYFKNCIITLKTNVNMFEFVGTNLDMYDGEFRVDNNLTFNHAIMYFGPNANLHSNINVYRPKIIGPNWYTGNLHSDYEAQLKQFDSDPDPYPTNGAGIMMYGTDTSPKNSTVFCNFIDYVISGFGIGVYLFSYSRSSNISSYFNSCKFKGTLLYTGKGYVLIGDNRGSSGYPCDVEFIGEYQTGAQSLVSGDTVDNIIYGGRAIKFDVKVWDSPRRCCETHLSLFVEPSYKILQDVDTIEGFSNPKFPNAKGRFSSCPAMDLEYSYFNKENFCKAKLDSEIIAGERILSGTKALDDSAPQLFLRYAGSNFFSIKEATTLDLSFKMKHNNDERINILAWAEVYNSTKYINPKGVYPLVRNTTQDAPIVVAIDAINKTITLDRDYTVNVGMYCIPEGHKSRNVTYNNTSSPAVEAYNYLPKVTAVDGRVITLDNRFDNETIVINQEVTFASTGNTEYSEAKLIGSKAPQLNPDYDEYSFTGFDLSKLSPYDVIVVRIQFYYLGSIDVTHNFDFKDIVLDIS